MAYRRSLALAGTVAVRAQKLLNESALRIRVDRLAGHPIDGSHDEIGKLRADLGHDSLFDLPRRSRGLGFALLLPLVCSRFGVCEDALGLLVGTRANLFGLAACFSQQRLSVGFGLLGCSPGLLCLLH